MIFNAMFYEGTLAILILIVYFYIEPKYQNSKEKGFFSFRTICNLIIMLPFAEFIIGFLLQSNQCSLTNKFCFAVPDIFRHTLWYDIFYLRVNDAGNGAHWLDYMFLPILFFITFWVTKDAFFSALNAGFMVFLHEVIWFITYWFEYFQYFKTEGWLNDIAFFILVCTIGFIGIKKYSKRYSWIWFYYGIAWYCVWILYWLFDFGLHVTVINNSNLGNSQQFLETIYYNNFSINALEVFSWIIIFTVFLVNILKLRRELNY